MQMFVIFYMRPLGCLILVYHDIVDIVYCRYENGSRYKLITRLKMESAQTITAMSAVNSFYSRIFYFTVMLYLSFSHAQYQR